MNAADDAANGISVADDAPERPVNKDVPARRLE